MEPALFMRTIKIRSGGQAFILENGDECPPSGVCFLTDEWEWAMKLSKSFVNDPEQLQAFWKTVMERKKDVPGYTVYMDFPREAFLKPEVSNKGLQICAEIIEMLKKHNTSNIVE